MQFKIGDKVRFIANIYSSLNPVSLKIGAEGVVRQAIVAGASVYWPTIKKQFYMGSNEIELIPNEMKKPKKVFSNSQKIRLRLKVYFDANDTGYDNFEEFYSFFTDSLLENLEFMASMFLK